MFHDENEIKMFKTRIIKSLSSVVCILDKSTFLPTRKTILFLIIGDVSVFIVFFLIPVIVEDSY